jgi:hypothetical protein
MKAAQDTPQLAEGWFTHCNLIHKDGILNLLIEMSNTPKE